jgi:hypothetical protein
MLVIYDDDNNDDDNNNNNNNNNNNKPNPFYNHQNAAIYQLISSLERLNYN